MWGTRKNTPTSTLEFFLFLFYFSFTSLSRSAITTSVIVKSAKNSLTHDCSIYSTFFIYSLSRSVRDGGGSNTRWVEQYLHFELHLEWRKRTGNHFEMP